jgi:hypothetical protein
VACMGTQALLAELKAPALAAQTWLSNTQRHSLCTNNYPGHSKEPGRPICFGLSVKHCSQMASRSPKDINLQTWFTAPSSSRVAVNRTTLYFHGVFLYRLNNLYGWNSCNYVLEPLAHLTVGLGTTARDIFIWEAPVCLDLSSCGFTPPGRSNRPLQLWVKSPMAFLLRYVPSTGACAFLPMLRYTCCQAAGCLYPSSRTSFRDSFSIQIFPVYPLGRRTQK